MSTMPLAAAKDKLFPERFGRLNAYAAPAFALVVSSLLASLLIGMNYTGGVVAAYQALFLMTTITAVVVYAACAIADLVLQIRATESGEALRWQSVLVAITAFLVSVFAIVGSGVRVAGYTSLLLVAGLPVYYLIRKTTAKT